MSPIYTNIVSKWKALRLSKDDKASSLSLLVSNIQLEAKTKKSEIDDTICISELTKTIKRIDDSFDIVKKANTVNVTDILKSLSIERDLYMSFLPEVMSYEKLIDILKECKTKQSVYITLKAYKGMYDARDLQKYLGEHPEIS